MERPRCEACPYWEYEEAISGIRAGSCHVEAPRRVPGDPDLFPTTGAGDFCGLHPDFTAYLESLRRHRPSDA